MASFKSPIGIASIAAAPFTGGLSLLAPTLFPSPVDQPKPSFPPIVTTTTGENEATEAAKQQKRRLAALQAGGQINTSRGGVLTDAPVARASLLGG